MGKTFEMLKEEIKYFAENWAEDDNDGLTVDLENPFDIQNTQIYIKEHFTMSYLYDSLESISEEEAEKGLEYFLEVYNENITDEDLKNLV